MAISFVIINYVIMTTSDDLLYFYVLYFVLFTIFLWCLKASGPSCLKRR